MRRLMLSKLTCGCCYVVMMKRTYKYSQSNSLLHALAYLGTGRTLAKAWREIGSDPCRQGPTCKRFRCESCDRCQYCSTAIFCAQIVIACTSLICLVEWQQKTDAVNCCESCPCPGRSPFRKRPKMPTGRLSQFGRRADENGKREPSLCSSSDWPRTCKHSFERSSAGLLTRSKSDWLLDRA